MFILDTNVVLSLWMFEDPALVRLRAAVEETQQLVELGGVLARSAKIEAAYGGGFSPALMQVSTDFAEVIAQIKRSLEVLGKERLVKD